MSKKEWIVATVVILGAMLLTSTKWFETPYINDVPDKKYSVITMNEISQIEKYMTPIEVERIFESTGVISYSELQGSVYVSEFTYWANNGYGGNVVIKYEDGELVGFSYANINEGVD